MKILFICTHNRCRSILAEAICNQYSTNLLARSAGSSPVGKVHPLSIQYLSQYNIPTSGLCSQSWDEHENFAPNIVITVCDKAAGEQCPVWFGDAVKIHWGLADPSAIKTSEDDIEKAFINTITTLRNRIETINSWQLKSLSSEQLKIKLEQLA